MFLLSAKVSPFRSISNVQAVRIDPNVTVLVGMNEAGKTVFLQALEKARDALGVAKFDAVEDYPRKDLPRYLKVHDTKPAVVLELRYGLTPEEVEAINLEFKTQLPADFSFGLTHKYDNAKAVDLHIDERPVVARMAAEPGTTSDASAAIGRANTIAAIPAVMKELSLSDADKALLATIEARIAAASTPGWSSVVAFEIWSRFLSKRVPAFLYFGDYDLLPSKTNLPDLAQRVAQAKATPAALQPEHRGILALLRMAGVSVADFNSPGGYEPLRAKLEGVSIALTDQIMAFWKQNEDLEVVIDIKADPTDAAPFNSGPNLYLRIANRRHRGVTTPFRQRSRGFIWFFSFLVWFDDVQQQRALQGGEGERDLVLLLDEPGLSLHALAQADFLRYIDNLSERHQVLYTTHSPFMVHMDKLHQVRLVEDRPDIGTIISETGNGADARTLFPLQAALGWTIAQSLFISERNLLVEGPSDLLYLKAVSAMLEAAGEPGLRDDVTIVPAGGLDKVVTFVALLGANGLKLAVLHDYRGAPEQKLLDLVKQKMLSARAVLNLSAYRTVPAPKVPSPTDIEDLLPIETYLAYFNAVFEKKMGRPVLEGDLPPGDRIIARVGRFLEQSGITLRASGGFNHYLVSAEFAARPPTLNSQTLGKFRALFADVNGLFD